MVWVFGVLSALILANRLVVREFSGRTQLFLELASSVGLSATI
jgi:hypothetical protein